MNSPTNNIIYWFAVIVKIITLLTWSKTFNQLSIIGGCVCETMHCLQTCKEYTRLFWSAFDLSVAQTEFQNVLRLCKEVAR